MIQNSQFVKCMLEDKVDENYVTTNNMLKDGHAAPTKDLNACIGSMFPEEEKDEC